MGAQCQAMESRLQSSSQRVWPSHCPVLWTSPESEVQKLLGTITFHRASEGHAIAEALRDKCEGCPSDTGIHQRAGRGQTRLTELTCPTGATSGPRDDHQKVESAKKMKFRAPFSYFWKKGCFSWCRESGLGKGDGVSRVPQCWATPSQGPADGRSL